MHVRRPHVQVAAPAQSFWLLTDRITLRLVGAETGGGLTVLEIAGQPELGPPPHIHQRQDECFYILEGMWEFMYEGAVFTVGAGSLVYMARGRLHSQKPVGKGPGRALVSYTPAGLEHFIIEAGTPVTDPSAGPAMPTTAGIERVLGIAMKHGIEVPPLGTIR
jgi:mannose-6-phosphate isomerase-like protein (cupin superfamily)